MKYGVNKLPIIRAFAILKKSKRATSAEHTVLHTQIHTQMHTHTVILYSNIEIHSNLDNKVQYIYIYIYICTCVVR